MTHPLDMGAFVPQMGFLQHRTGDRIKERYDVVQRLGGGNFGSVYRVLDTAVGNILACKEMHVLDNPDTTANERALALDLFKREALNLATLRHPNIPAAYFDQEDGEWHICPVCGLHFDGVPFCPDHNATLLAVNSRYYLMMDFVDGPTLEECAAQQMSERGRPLEEVRCLEWVHQIATALRTLHRVGIIHRDIKPDNIKIRDGDDAAILLDFGLTKKVEEAGGYGTAPLTGTARFGTAGYAPENPRERARPERRSDIHALGMTLYRLVSGRDPQNEAQLREMRDFSPRYFNREISPDTEHLILTSIAPELSLRYQTLDDFLSDLDSIRQPQGYQAPLPPFTFADGSRARNATELARLLETHQSESEIYLVNGMFAAWLMQYGFAAPAQTAEQVVKVYANNPPRALELLRRSLYPTGTSHILPQLETEPKTVNLGSIDSGSKIEFTLRVRNAGPGLAWGKLGVPAKRPSGKTGLAAAVQGILAGGSGDEESTLPGLSYPAHFQGNDEFMELVLDTVKVPTGSYSSHLVIETDGGSYDVPVSYTVVPLHLKTEPEVLDFGIIQVGKRADALVAVVPSEATIGKPRGTIYAGPSLAGLTAPERFEGVEPFTVTVDASSPSAVARMYEGLIQIDTNGGRLRLPVRYVIALAPGAFVTVIGEGLFWGAVAGAALRFGYYLVNPEFAAQWLLKFTPSGTSLAEPLFKPIGPLLAGAAGGLVGGWMYGNRLKQMLKDDRPAVFRDSDDTVFGTLPMLGLFFGSFGGYLLASLLHYTVWSLGDWLLYPVGHRLFPQWVQQESGSAPGIWAGAGAVAGLVWGLGRVLSATGRGGGRYFFIIVAAVVFLLLLFNATLTPGS